jgi:hypothetical protein
MYCCVYGCPHRTAKGVMLAMMALLLRFRSNHSPKCRLGAEVMSSHFLVGLWRPSLTGDDLNPSVIPAAPIPKLSSSSISQCDDAWVMIIRVNLGESSRSAPLPVQCTCV